MQKIHSKERISDICSGMKVGDKRNVLLIGAGLTQDQASLEAGKINHGRADHVWIEVQQNGRSAVDRTYLHLRVSA